MFTWEKENLSELLVLLDNTNWKRQDFSGADRWVWIKDSLKVYSVRSGYAELCWDNNSACLKGLDQLYVECGTCYKDMCLESLIK